MSLVRSRAALALLIFLALGSSACDSLPGAPGSDPTGWIPSIAPSDLSGNGGDGPYGYTPGERAAVRVRNEACTELATGSGFAIDGHTIVTNRHVVDGYGILQVTTSDGRDLTVASVSTISIADLALITTVETLDSTVTLSSTDPVLGDDVTVIGYPLGDELRTTKGEIVQRADDPFDNADHVWLTSATAEHGSSGSAAYNDAGEVFGVLFAGEDATGRSYIIPVSLLQAALDDPSIVTTLAPACEL